MDKLLLHTHTGLGDHIITNGMAHAFAERYDKVLVIHIKQLGESVRALYAGHNKIQTIEFPDIDVTRNGMDMVRKTAEIENAELISIADPYLVYPRRYLLDKDNNLTVQHVATNFDRQFYELAGMHFSIRYTKSRIPNSTKRSREILGDLSKGQPFRLVHNTSSQNNSGYPLEFQKFTKFHDLPFIEILPGITNNVFDFVDLIKHASEIHTVGSFFHHIVDSMIPQTNAELFFHNIMMKHDTQINCFWNNNRWSIVEYDRKY